MTITSANSVLMLGVTGLYDTPQQLQGFAQDDAYSMDTVDTAETMIGVDGFLSAGKVFAVKVMNVTLQADSPSNSFFEDWFQAQESAREVYPAFGIVDQASVGRSYTLNNGYLKNYSPMADAKKVMQPRKFQIHWESAVPAPL